MDFSNREFNTLSFIGRILIGVNFTNTVCKERVDFKRVTFINLANFEEVIFKDRARFDHVTFDNTVYFKRAKFEEIALFNHSIFKVGAYFQGAEFLAKAGPTRVLKGGAGFKGSVFAGESSFEDVDFRFNTSFDSTEFQDLVHFKGATFRSSTDFQRIRFKREADFSCAKFLNQVVFNDASFEAVTSFDDALFKQPPKFFETKLHEDTDFSDVDWSEAESSYKLSKQEMIQTCFYKRKTESTKFEAEDTIRAWDRLALVMSRLEKLPERHEFYRRRMRAQRWKDGCGLLSTANWIFDVSSDYGWSVFRSLGWWFCHWSLMALVLFASTFFCATEQGHGTVLLNSFLTSFANAHAFLGLATEGGYLHGVRMSIALEIPNRYVLEAIGVIQAVLGPIFLFLVLLTLRNRFRLR